MSFINILNDAMEQSAKNTKVNEGDYYNEDGLLYCGKCRTPKQVEIDFFGEKRRPYCICECEKQEREREEKARKAVKLREAAFSEREMETWTFANDDNTNERLTKAMQAYVDKFSQFVREGKGLLLYGSTGTGKTYAACEIANALLDKCYPVLVTNFARVLNELQGTFEKQSYIDSFNKYALLVIDDLGIERDTAFAMEQVYNIIDSRYRAGLPMIITTNLTIDKIKNPETIEHRRVYERILERCHPIEVSGQSRRRKAIRESYGGMQELLGL